MKLKSILYFFCIITLSACHKGCTTTRSLQSKSKVINSNGLEGELIATLKEHRHSRGGNKRNVFDRTVTYSYSIEFSGRVNGSGKFYIANQYTNDADVALEPLLDDLSFKASKNHSHAAFGYKDLTKKVIHFYNGEPYDNLSFTNATGKLTDLNLDEMPSTKEIILNQLKNDFSCNSLHTKKKLVYRILDDLPPTSPTWKSLLKNWPKCWALKDYFNDGRVARLSKNAAWQKMAKERAINTISGRSFNKEKGFEMLQYLGIDGVKDIKDSIYIAKWNDRSSRTELEYMIENYASFSEKNKQEMITQAQRPLEYFFSHRSKNPKLADIGKTLSFLNFIGDTSSISKFISKSFQARFLDRNSFMIRDVLFDLYPDLNTNLQKEIVSTCVKNFSNIHRFYRDDFYKNVSLYLDCDQAKLLLKKYKRELKDESLPEKCYEQ